jgi:hypothetical protein
MFHKKREEENAESENYINELELRLSSAEKKIELLSTANEKLIMSYVTRTEVFDDMKDRIIKLEKDIEKEKVGSMYR